jgi:nitroreductase
MEKRAETIYPIHEVLERRWSPRAFADRPIEAEKLRSLFEAARWTASSMNEQPWRFILACRTHAEDFEKAAACLMPMNRAWAQHAPVLVFAIAKNSVLAERSAQSRGHLRSWPSGGKSCDAGDIAWAQPSSDGRHRYRESPLDVRRPTGIRARNGYRHRLRRRSRNAAGRTSPPRDCAADTPPLRKICVLAQMGKTVTAPRRKGLTRQRHPFARRDHRLIPCAAERFPAAPDTSLFYPCTTSRRFRRTRRKLPGRVLRWRKFSLAAAWCC